MSDSANCPFCMSEIKPEDEVNNCPACGIPHHLSCWEENKGCTTLGCSEQHYEPQGTNISEVCANCGAPLGDGEDFCPKCGVKKGALSVNVCCKCGAQLQDGQEFCPKCGQEVGIGVDLTAGSKIVKLKEHTIKKSKKKIIAATVIVCILAIAIVAVVLIIRGIPVEEVALSTSEVSIDVGEKTTLSYTISPSDATDKTVIWESSNEDIAQVSDGVVMAVKEGSCTITVSANNGASDTCRVVVEDKIDFSELFSEYKSMTWCSIASDGSYMKVDTNPNDEDNFTDFVSYMAIYGINSKLGFSEALIEKMNQTRSMDGRLTDANDKVAVSWTYHPDQGLEVLYENK